MTEAAGELSENQKEFLLAEYSEVKSDILSRVERIENDMSHGLLAAGGIWAWVLASDNNRYRQVSILIPAAITGFLGIKYLYHRHALATLSEYARKLEERFDVARRGLGFETYRFASTTHRFDGLWLMLGVFFWLAFAGVNIATAVYVDSLGGAP